MGKRQRKEQYKKLQKKREKREADSDDEHSDTTPKGAHTSRTQQQAAQKNTSGNDALERLQVLVENERSFVHQPIGSILKSCWSCELSTSPPSADLKLTRKSLGIKVKQEADDDISSSNPVIYCAPPLAPTCFRNESNNENPDDNELSPKAYSSGEALPSLFHSVFSENKKYKGCTPTPVQLQVWPAMLSTAHNLFSIAPTGSGKTLAYALPLVQMMLRMMGVDDDCGAKKAKKQKKSAKKKNPYKSKNGPLALVILPTRELAQQVNREVKGICRTAKILYPNVQIRSMALYGGASKQEQLEEFNEAGFVHILAATPGRLIDVLADNYFSLRNVTCLVLDEADRMLQLGFKESMDAVSNYIRPDRLTCMFSATSPSKLVDVCNIWLPEPRVHIRASTITLDLEQDGTPKGAKQKLQNSSEKVSKPEQPLKIEGKDAVENEATDAVHHHNAATPSKNLEFASIPSNLVQVLHVCAGHKKPKKLLKTITKLREKEEQAGVRNPGLCIIFFNKIKTLKFMKKFLSENLSGCKISRISELHGQMPQFARDSALTNFRHGKINTLLATDVAARGIHINNVAYVINYDFPGSLEQYVHRCGRAGRSSGTEKKKKSSACVYSFFSREFAPMAPDMLSLLQSSKSEYIDPNLVNLAREVLAKREKQIVNREKEKVAAPKKSKKNELADDQILNDSDEGNDDIDGQFKLFAVKGSIKLKRAAHMSDASSDEESDSED